MPAAPMLRRVGMEAAELLAVLCREAFSDGSEVWSEQDFSQILRLPTTVALVAEVSAASGEKNPAGYILFTELAGESEILTLGVMPEWRQRGIGRRLVEALFEHDPDFTERRLFLEVREDNKAALALYESLGFIAAGRRKGYYLSSQGRRVDALIMRSIMSADPAKTEARNDPS